MKQVIILQGLPASGKTTWAKELVKEMPGRYKRVNKDDLRAMLDNGRWTNGNENFVLEIRDQTILAALKDGRHVIVDDTNLHQKHIDRIKAIVAGLATVRIEFFDIDPKEAVRRDSLRSESVGEKVIMDMYNKYLKPEPEQYVPPAGKPKAVIFDIDGTLAKMNDRGPYDWKRVGEDSPNKPVCEALDVYRHAGYKIIIFTGRDGICELATKVWLSRHYIDYDHFFMRPEGNTEKDAVIKKRMFDEIKDDFQIVGVYDDRDQVVEMWRDLGLTCFQVAKGDF